MPKGVKGFQKGHKNYFLGHTAESKNKLRTASLKQFENGMPEETRKKLGEKAKNRITSDETKLKQSMAHLGIPKPDGFGEKVSKRLKGISHNHGWKVSATKQKQIAAGIFVSSFKGKEHTEEAKQKNREATIDRLINGKYPQTNTKIELIMEDKLKELNIEYVHPFNFNNKFECDFAIPSKKIIIECDGDYWHRRSDALKRDAPKNVYIPKCGWTLLRFWEKDIHNNIDICMSIIKENLYDTKNN